MSLFRKPKKNIRNRIEIEDEESQNDNDDGIDQIHLNINKLKEKKKEKKKNRDEKPKEKKASTMLSFDDDMEEEVEFKVKKSKESRRLIKMKQREKKEDNKNCDEDVKVLGDQNGNRSKNVHVIDDDIGIVLKVSKVFKVRQLIAIKSSFQDNVAKKPQDTWIISGKEAEALHLEEEDFSEKEEQSDDDEDPIQKIIQSRYLFSLFYTITLYTLFINLFVRVLL